MPQMAVKKPANGWNLSARAQTLEQNVNAYFDRAAALTGLPTGLLDQIRE
jgi:hypothetical protein